MAVELRDVDSRTVSAGGVITANLPHAARNFRRSAIEAASSSGCDMALSFARR
jgi:hypothetical protein